MKAPAKATLKVSIVTSSASRSFEPLELQALSTSNDTKKKHMIRIQSSRSAQADVQAQNRMLRPCHKPATKGRGAIAAERV
jgi:hypothetical protein